MRTLFIVLLQLSQFLRGFMFIPKWNELKSGAKVVKYFDVCNSMCLFWEKIIKKRSKKTQAIYEKCWRGKDTRLWGTRKRHMPVRERSIKRHMQKGDILKKTHGRMIYHQKDTCLNSLLERDKHRTPYRKVTGKSNGKSNV